MARKPTEVGLFLDGSGFVGWSIMSLASMDLIEAGTFQTEPAEPGVWGIRWLLTATFVDKMIVARKPALIGFESPFMPPPPPRNAKARAAWKGFRVNQDTLRFLIGVDSMFEMVAARHGLPCREVNVATVKASLAGAAKKIERDAELDRMRARGATAPEVKVRQRELMKIDKADMMRACWARGWDVKDEHQADACGVGKVMIEERWKSEGRDHVSASTSSRKRRRVVRR